jgi:type II secretory pathway pseudopilin PulG
MHTRTPQPARCTTRRGFSFLEAVLAATLLAIVASSIFSVLGYAMASDRTDTVRLGAAEVANRLLITYLDDSTSIRKLPDTIDYGSDTFRWELDEDTVRIEEPNRHRRVTSGRSGAVPTALVRLKEIRVTVWHDDGTTASRLPGSTPGVRLNRLVNPFGYRGADSTERLLESPDRITELLKNISGFEEPDVDSPNSQGTNP